MSNTNTTSKGAKSSRRRRNATTTTTDTGNTGGAAAAEPEPEPPGSTSATSYNVRDYQNPDAGAEQALTTPTKTKKKGKKGSKAVRGRQYRILIGLEVVTVSVIVSMAPKSLISTGFLPQN